MILEMTGKPEFGIPSASHCRVISLPEQQTVWEGEASGSIAIDLPPGYYCLSVVKFHKRNNYGICYTVNYEHGATKEQVHALARMDIAHVRANYTSGGVKYSCTVSGCENVEKSLFSAKVHEGAHFGADLLNNPGDAMRIEDAVNRMAPRVTAAISPATSQVPVTLVPSASAQVQAKKAPIPLGRLLPDVNAPQAPRPVAAAPPLRNLGATPRPAVVGERKPAVTKE